MKHKLTKMSYLELVAYDERHTKKQGRFQQGSSNWRKEQRRIKNAGKQMRG